MWTVFIIVFDVVGDPFFKLSHGLVIMAVKLFTFKTAVEAFDDCVICWSPSSGKRLNNTVFPEKIPKGIGCILAALITMKN